MIGVDETAERFDGEGGKLGTPVGGTLVGSNGVAGGIMAMPLPEPGRGG